MMAFFGIVAWIVFCIRDYWLLEALPARRKVRDIRRYLAAVICAAAFVTLALYVAPRPQVVMLSRPLLVAALAAHAAISAWSVWLGRGDRFSGAWKLALCPSPAAWILLFIASDAMSSGDSRRAVLLTAAIAIASGLIVALAGLRFSIEKGDRDDFMFPIRFAACSNCLALCLLPLMAS